jgi:hypothetical protein
VESGQRFLLEHPERLRDKHWQNAKYVMDDIAMRGGIRAAWHAILIAVEQDARVH